MNIKKMMSKTLEAKEASEVERLLKTLEEMKEEYHGYCPECGYNFDFFIWNNCPKCFEAKLVKEKIVLEEKRENAYHHEYLPDSYLASAND